MVYHNHCINTKHCHIYMADGEDNNYITFIINSLLSTNTLSFLFILQTFYDKCIVDRDACHNNSYILKFYEFNVHFSDDCDDIIRAGLKYA